MKIEKIKKIVLIVSLTMCTLMYAQISTGPGEPPGCDNPPCVDQAPEYPIDGGLSFLLIAGAACGIYAIKKNKKLN